jgi:competence protein ComEC
MALVYLSVAWIIGTYLGSRLALHWGIIFAAFVPLVLIPFFHQYIRQLILAGFCLLCLFGGCIRFQADIPVVNQHALQFYNDSGIVVVEGTICTAPEPGNTTSSFQISADRVKYDGAYVDASGRALVTVLRYPEYHYGDVLRLTGKLQTPALSDDDFNYRDYLARQGVYSIISYPRVEVLDTGKGFKPLAWIYSLRESLARSLSQALPEPPASIAQGILLGMRGNIPDYLNQAFSRTGTAHLLAISGINISIVIGMILAAGIWLFGKRYSIYIWLTLLVIWVYALLTGMNPPVVRAAIMGSLFLIAEFLGRQSSALIALTFAAAIMVGLEPQILWTASFQLSFLAMTGLIIISPYLQTIGSKKATGAVGAGKTAVSSGIFATNSFLITLAAILASWPVIAYYFHVVSFVGLPATFFAALALPPIITTAALVAAIGLIIPLVAQMLGWISWLFISYFVLVVRVFDALPFSSIQLNNIELWQIWLYYIVLAATITAVYYRGQLTRLIRLISSRLSPYLSRIPNFVSKVPKKWIISPLLIVSIIIWVAVLNMPDNKLHISILDVGQGDAILIQTPNRQDILIDGGPSPESIDLELSKRLPFWDRTIDLVVLTQPQADHLSGLLEVLQNYKVMQVYDPGIDYDSNTYQQWLNLVKAKGIKPQKASSGHQIDLGDGIKLAVLNPSSPFLQGTSDDVDNNGIALRLSWNAISFLFTADLGKEAEWHLIAQRSNLNSTVLKVGHHGSLTSTSEQFLAAVNPQLAIISVGPDNRFGLPCSEIMDRLADQIGSDRVYLTSTHGTIEIITDGNRLWLKHDK